MKELDEITKEYLNECAKMHKNDESMVEYFRKNIDFVIKLNNGMFMPFEKPRIETSFCFGYSDMGQGPEREDAYKDCEHARSNEDYFLAENLKRLNDYIDELSDESEDIRYCRKYRNWKGGEEVNVCELSTPKYWGFTEDLPRLSAEDRKLILDGVTLQKAHFEKRLKTYLKRYGLKKLKTWTYWMDY